MPEKTLVTSAGSAGKFLAVLDLDIGKGGLKDARYQLLPVFANLLTPNREMQALIEREPRIILGLSVKMNAFIGNIECKARGLAG
jgi:2',3'-cyclic-nucleotide 2'-phosphodiesterase (5'-nucleotidase family)